jgi:hypothetical protein
MFGSFFIYFRDRAGSQRDRVVSQRDPWDRRVIRLPARGQHCLIPYSGNAFLKKRDWLRSRRRAMSIRKIDASERLNA